MLVRFRLRRRLIASKANQANGGAKAGLLAQSMAAAGLDAKDVKTIVVSHFHPDHISGLMAKDTNAQMFPEAEIIVPAVEAVEMTDGEAHGTLPCELSPIAFAGDDAP